MSRSDEQGFRAGSSVLVFWSGCPSRWIRDTTYLAPYLQAMNPRTLTWSARDLQCCNLPQNSVKIAQHSAALNRGRGFPSSVDVEISGMSGLVLKFRRLVHADETDGLSVFLGAPRGVTFGSDGKSVSVNAGAFEARLVDFRPG